MCVNNLHKFTHRFINIIFYKNTIYKHSAPNNEKKLLELLANYRRALFHMQMYNMFVDLFVDLTVNNHANWDKSHQLQNYKSPV